MEENIARSRTLWLILALALALRLAVGLTQDPLAPYGDTGSDSGWYLGTAYALITNTPPTGTASDGANLTPPPFYFVEIGVPEALLSPAAAVIAVRILQALLSAATCYFAYALALRLTQRERAALLAAGVLAISPVFIVEAAQIMTETTYIFFMVGGLWLYIESIQPLTPNPSPTQAGRGVSAPLQADDASRQSGGRWSLALLLMAAVLFGLATLTRVVLLLFPIGIAIHLLMVRGGWRRAALFLLVYTLVVSTWTVYSLARWNRFVVGGEGLPAFLYLGATGWSGPEGVDAQLAQQSPDQNYLQAAEGTIGSDPLGWVKHRLDEWIGAYLQPHGTAFYPGESLKEIAAKWITQDRSLAGLIALTRADAFWPKLALYVFHFAGLIFGVIGMWLYRRRWQIALPMIGFIVYISLVHLALYAVPRYLFPNEVFWWIFAAAALERIVAAAISPLKKRRAFGMINAPQSKENS